MLKKHSSRGFTIVELLIVIIVVAILVAITITAYNGVQDRARASTLANGIKQVDKAFHLFATDQNISTWWNDHSFTGYGNPTISDIISQTNLKLYLQKVPKIPGFTGSWRYDSDGDSVGGCGSTRGVNIIIYNLSDKLINDVDKAIDDGSLTCGRIFLWNNGGSQKNLVYHISKTSSVE